MKTAATNTGLFVCEVCGDTFYFSANFDAHRFLAHPEPCKHDVLAILSNGTKQCLSCKKLLVPESLAHLYSGPGYAGRIEIVEESK